MYLAFSGAHSRHLLRRAQLMLSSGLLGLVWLGLYGAGAFAQTATPPADTSTAANKKTDTPTTVTVTAAKPQNRIDRQVYDNTKNIDSATGNAADALNKVPSVNVDPDGKVTLRGQSNVTVLVDGKPSAMMSGDNRAGALQSMASSDIESIEVINNPSAQFSSDGTGGMINLVMKRNRRPGKFGSATVAVGPDGRYNGGVTGSYNNGKVTLTGGLNYRKDKRPSRSGLLLQRKDSNGNVVSSTEQSGDADTTFSNLSMNGGIDYNISDKDTIGSQVSFSHRDIDTVSHTLNASYDAANVQTSRYLRNTNMTGPHDDMMLDLRWDHTGNLPGETLKTDLRVARSYGDQPIVSENDYTVPSVTALVDTKNQKNDLKNAVFSVDYTRPVGQAQLTTGIQITHDDNEFKNTATGPDAIGATPTVNAALTNDFAYTQTLSAAYVTYQMPLGPKWIVMGGLRAEALDLKTNEVTSGTTSHIRYTKVSPSAFATYTLTDKAKLRFSYSHRLQRPNPQDLNPFLTYVDAQNVTSGNPNLKPQETDSYEAGYEYNGSPLVYQLRAYYRKNTNTITSYSYFLSPGVLLTTKQNYGTGQSGGLEFNANGKLTPQLTLSANGNLAYKELSTPTVAGTQSATTLSGRVSLDYAATLKDRIQFSVFSSGKQLTGQGYSSAFSMGNISYRHQYDPKTALVITVNDPFKTAKFVNVTDTTTIHSVSTRSLQGPTFYIGFTRTFGGAPAASQQQQGSDGRPNGGGMRMMGPGGPGGSGI